MSNIHNVYDKELPPNTRGFYDSKLTGEWTKEYTLDAFKKSLNKIESPDYKLKVTDIDFKEPNKEFSIKEQKRAVLEKRDLTLPIEGTIELIDKKTGNVVDKKKTTIAHLPYITNRNTTIINGSEYSTTNMQRLKPGVYTRIKDSGEVEAHVNVKSGTGMGGKLLLDPVKTIFTYQVGSSQIKLYGLLRDLGIPDSMMEKAWGTEVFNKNKSASDGKEIDKFYNKVFKDYDK